MNYDPIYSALFFLFKVALACGFYEFARRMLKDDTIPVLQGVGYLAVATAVLIFLAWQNVGTHFDNSEADPIYGSGERVVDFVATEKQRNEAALYTLTLSGLLFSVGAVVGFGERSKRGR